MTIAAETITAASATRGNSASSGRIASSATTTKAEATSDTNCVLLPRDAGTAVRLALDETGNPCDSPDDRFVRPSASSSWLASIR